MLETDLAWAAGFVDGEGCMYLSTANNGLRVGQKDRRPLLKLVKLFGGRISPRNEVFEWYLWGAEARRVIELISPYLVLKASQADVMLEWFAQPWRGKGHHRTPDQIQADSVLRNLCSALKRDYR